MKPYRLAFAPQASFLFLGISKQFPNAHSNSYENRRANQTPARPYRNNGCVEAIIDWYCAKQTSDRFCSRFLLRNIRNPNRSVLLCQVDRLTSSGRQRRVSALPLSTELPCYRHAEYRECFSPNIVRFLFERQKTLLPILDYEAVI